MGQQQRGGWGEEEAEEGEEEKGGEELWEEGEGEGKDEEEREEVDREEEERKLVCKSRRVCDQPAGRGWSYTCLFSLFQVWRELDGCVVCMYVCVWVGEHACAHVLLPRICSFVCVGFEQL